MVRVDSLLLVRQAGGSSFEVSLGSGGRGISTVPCRARCNLAEIYLDSITEIYRDSISARLRLPYSIGGHADTTMTNRASHWPIRALGEISQPCRRGTVGGSIERRSCASKEIGNVIFEARETWRARLARRYSWLAGGAARFGGGAPSVGVLGSPRNARWSRRA